MTDIYRAWRNCAFVSDLLHITYGCNLLISWLCLSAQFHYTYLSVVIVETKRTWVMSTGMLVSAIVFFGVFLVGSTGRDCRDIALEILQQKVYRVLRFSFPIGSIWYDFKDTSFHFPVKLQHYWSEGFVNDKLRQDHNWSSIVLCKRKLLWKHNRSRAGMVQVTKTSKTRTLEQTCHVLWLKFNDCDMMIRSTNYHICFVFLNLLALHNCIQYAFKNCKLIVHVSQCETKWI
jgi:hypothetical protein